ncbi:MAG: CDP-diacylglycerol--serine O-phosphatidyltransferase [Andreesenia angusta]|nr:CDP-diacylglycerol--serine O-phosphatidyltransferase [Andreesenia angusta]
MKIKNNLPNIFTLTNLALGCWAIINMFYGDLFFSSLLIIMAGMMDRFDGMIARKLNATSDIGKQLDSLSDLISFGIAPAILIWNISLNLIPYAGTIIAVIYILSGAFRLARYNVTEFDGIYRGIPITLAGGLISLLSLYILKYKMVNNIVVAVFVVFLSYAMITTKIQLKKR